MYKLLQNAALIILAVIGMNAFADMSDNTLQTRLIEAAGFSLVLLLAGDALRTLWRS